MPSPPSTIDADLEAVRRALAAVEPQSKRLLLYCFGEACGYGSRARGEARPDSDSDLLVVMPQGHAQPDRTPAGVAIPAGGVTKATNCMTPAERQQLLDLLEAFHAEVRRRLS